MAEIDHPAPVSKGGQVRSTALNKISPIQSNKQRSCKKLNQGVAKGEFYLTITAASAQQEPAQNRKVVVPGQPVFAFRTMAWRLNNGKALRNAIDDDVQEATGRGSHREKKEHPNQFRWIKQSTSLSSKCLLRAAHLSKRATKVLAKVLNTTARF